MSESEPLIEELPLVFGGFSLIENNTNQISQAILLVQTILNIKEKRIAEEKRKNKLYQSLLLIQSVLNVKAAAARKNKISQVLLLINLF